MFFLIIGRVKLILMNGSLATDHSYGEPGQMQYTPPRKRNASQIQLAIYVFSNIKKIDQIIQR